MFGAVEQHQRLLPAMLHAVRQHAGAGGIVFQKGWNAVAEQLVLLAQPADRLDVAVQVGPLIEAIAAR